MAGGMKIGSLGHPMDTVLPSRQGFPGVAGVWTGIAAEQTWMEV